MFLYQLFLMAEQTLVSESLEVNYEIIYFNYDLFALALGPTCTQ